MPDKYLLVQKVMYVGHAEIAPRNVVDEHGFNYLSVPGRPMPRDPQRFANVCFIRGRRFASLSRYVPAGGNRAALYGPAGVLQGSASKVEFVAVLNDGHRVSPSVSTGPSL